jgi:hypothetical protein
LDGILVLAVLLAPAPTFLQRNATAFSKFTRMPSPATFSLAKASPFAKNHHHQNIPSKTFSRKDISTFPRASSSASSSDFHGLAISI